MNLELIAGLTPHELLKNYKSYLYNDFLHL